MKNNDFNFVKINKEQQEKADKVREAFENLAEQMRSLCPCEYTLLAVLARHLDPTAGTYTVDGTDVTDSPLEEVRALFAIVDDEPHVLAGSLRANLALAAPEADDAQLVTALRRAGLGGWLDDLPDGLDTRLGTGGHGVSGGERTRLSIARAIASGRPIILLDEPVAHLDHPTATAVITDLLEHAGGRSVVMVTHHDVGLERMDRIVTTVSEGSASRVAASAPR